MRSILLGSTLVGLALAAPSPQLIDLDLADAVPNPSYTTTLSVVTYNPTAILESALPQITSSVAIDSLVATSDGANNKVKRTACAPQPTGAGPVPSPDSPSAFLAYSSFAAAATNAPLPSGYSQTYKNLQGASNAYGYMGYSTLSTYDSNACAAKCNKVAGCMAFNIFFERDPTVDPGTGASGCANPASTTNIKCVLWGGPVNSDNAVNTGQWRNQFQVVIAGSNGYVNNTLIDPAGYNTPLNLGNAAINAPYDVYGFDSYMGSAIFNSGPFNSSLCAAACSQKSAYNLAHPPTDGSPVETCQFFNTYILYENNITTPQGQYCAMYSESWDASYATNVGQYRGSDHFFIANSWAFSNATNPGSPSPNAAIHQASKDISYSTLQTFCSSLLGYTTPVTTTTSTVTIVPTSTTTAISLTTVTDVVTTGQQAAVNKRAAVTPAAALSTPDVLTKYPTNILSSACQLQATPVTSTSTTTLLTTTTAPTSIATVSIVSTVTSTTTTTTLSTFTLYGTPIPGGYSYNDNSPPALVYAGTAGQAQGGRSSITFTTDVGSASQFTLDETTGIVADLSDSGDYLYDETFFGGTPTGGFYWVVAASLDTASTDGLKYTIDCAIDPTTSQFTCTYLGTQTTEIYNCDGVVGFVQPGSESSIEEFCNSAYELNLYAVPVVV